MIGRHVLGLCLSMGCLCTNSIRAQEAPGPKNPPEFNARLLREQGTTDAGLTGRIELQVRTDGEALGKYWIGLLCTPPSEALRVQLDLPADVGLQVDEVTDKGPAMKAGIQKYDVLLAVTLSNKAEAQQLANVEELIKLVQQSGNTPLKIDFLRRGRKQTLEVVPAERPKDPAQHAEGLWMRWAGPMVVRGVVAMPDGMSIDYTPAIGQPEKMTVKKGDQSWTVTPNELDKLPEDLRGIAQQDLAIHVAKTVRQGLVVLGGSAPGGVGVAGGGGGAIFVHSATTALPDDMTVTITRHGSDPATIQVKKGDQVWDTTERDLAKLPENVRPMAEMMLSGHAHARATRAVTIPVPPMPIGDRVRFRRLDVQDHPNDAVPGAMPPQTVRRNTEGTPTEVERQLKDLAEQVEKLRQAVEKTQSPK